MESPPSFQEQQAPAPSSTTIAAAAVTTTTGRPRSPTATATATWDPTLYNIPFHTDRVVFCTDQAIQPVGSISDISPPPLPPPSRVQQESPSSPRPTRSKDLATNVSRGAGVDWIAGALKKDTSESSCTHSYSQSRAAAVAATTAIPWLWEPSKGDEGQQQRQEAEPQQQKEQKQRSTYSRSCVVSSRLVLPTWSRTETLCCG